VSRTRVRVAAASGIAAFGLTLLATWLTGLSLERAVVLAPVIVLSAGAAAALLIVWGRVIWDSLKRSRHPYRIVAIAAGALALLIGLTLLGIKLPHE
jgi:xanthine/uracil/vitamin C permease (AzgA family)